MVANPISSSTLPNHLDELVEVPKVPNQTPHHSAAGVGIRPAQDVPRGRGV